MSSLKQHLSGRTSSDNAPTTTKIPVHIPKNKELDEEYVISLLAKIKLECKSNATAVTTTSSSGNDSCRSKVDATMSIREKMRVRPVINAVNTTNTISHISNNSNSLQVRLPTNSKELNEDFVKNLLSDLKRNNTNNNTSIPITSTTTTPAPLKTDNDDDDDDNSSKTSPARMKSIDDLLNKIKKDVRNWKTTATTTTSPSDEDKNIMEADDTIMIEEQPSLSICGNNNTKQESWNTKETHTTEDCAEQRDDNDDCCSEKSNHNDNAISTIMDGDVVKDVTVPVPHMNDQEDKEEAKNNSEDTTTFQTTPTYQVNDNTDLDENHLSTPQPKSESISEAVAATTATPSDEFTLKVALEEEDTESLDESTKPFDSKIENSCANINTIDLTVTVNETLLDVEEQPQKTDDNQLTLLCSNAATATTTTIEDQVEEENDYSSKQQQEPLVESLNDEDDNNISTQIEEAMGEYKDIEDIWNTSPRNREPLNIKAIVAKNIEDVWNTSPKNEEPLDIEDIWNTSPRNEKPLNIKALVAIWSDEKDDDDDALVVVDDQNKSNKKDEIKEIEDSWSTTQTQPHSKKDINYDKSFKSKPSECVPQILESAHKTNYTDTNTNHDENQQQTQEQKISDFIPEISLTQKELDSQQQKLNHFSNNSTIGSLKRLTLACVNSIAFEVILSEDIMKEQEEEENEDDDDHERKGEECCGVSPVIGEAEGDAGATSLLHSTTTTGKLPLSCSRDDDDEEHCPTTSTPYLKEIICQEHGEKKNEKVGKEEQQPYETVTEEQHPLNNTTTQSTKLNQDAVNNKAATTEDDLQENEVEEIPENDKKNTSDIQIIDSTTTVNTTNNSEINENAIFSFNLSSSKSSSSDADNDHNNQHPLSSTAAFQFVKDSVLSSPSSQNNSNLDNNKKPYHLDCTLDNNNECSTTETIIIVETETTESNSADAISKADDTISEEEDDTSSAPLEEDILEITKEQIMNQDNTNDDTTYTPNDENQHCVTTSPNNNIHELKLRSHGTNKNNNNNHHLMSGTNILKMRNNKLYSDDDSTTHHPIVPFKTTSSSKVNHDNCVDVSIENVTTDDTNSPACNNGIAPPLAAAMTKGENELTTIEDVTNNNTNKSSLSTSDNNYVLNNYPSQDINTNSNNKQDPKTELMNIISQTKSQEEYQESNAEMNQLLQQLSATTTTVTTNVATTPVVKNLITIAQKNIDTVEEPIKQKLTTPCVAIMPTTTTNEILAPATTVTTNVATTPAVKNLITIAQKNIDTVEEPINKKLTTPCVAITLTTTTNEILAPEHNNNAPNLPPGQSQQRHTKSNYNSTKPKSTVIPRARRFCPEDDDGDDIEFIPNNNRLSRNVHTPSSSIGGRRTTPSSSSTRTIGIQNVRNTTTASISRNYSRNMRSLGTGTPSSIRSTGIPSSIRSTGTPSSIRSTGPALNIKSNETPLNIKSNETPSSIRSNGTPLNIRSTGTSSSIRSTATSLNIRSTETPSSIRSTRTPLNIRSTRTPLNIRSNGTPSHSARILGAPSSIISTGTPSRTARTSGTTSNIRSCGTPSHSARTSGTTSNIRSYGTPSRNARTSGTASNIKSTRTPSQSPRRSETPKIRNIGTPSQHEIITQRILSSRQPEKFTFSRPATPSSSGNGQIRLETTDYNNIRYQSNTIKRDCGPSATKDKTYMTALSSIEPPIPTSFSYGSTDEDVSIITNNTDTSKPTPTLALRRLADQTAQRLSVEDKTLDCSTISYKDNELRHKKMINLIEKLSKGKLSNKKN